MVRDYLKLLVLVLGFTTADAACHGRDSVAPNCLVFPSLGSPLVYLAARRPGF